VNPALDQPTLAGDWAWTLADSPARALAVLNGGAGSRSVATARVAAAHHHGQAADRGDFFVFHQHESQADPVGAWRWQAVSSAEDVREAVEHRRGRPADFQPVAPATGVGHFQVFSCPRARTGQPKELAGARSATV